MIADTDVLREFDNLLSLCANIGLFIVPVGELESWLVDYGIPRSTNKKIWILRALEKVHSINYDSGKEIWLFIDKLKKFLIW